MTVGPAVLRLASTGNVKRLTMGTSVGEQGVMGLAAQDPGATVGIPVLGL